MPKFTREDLEQMTIRQLRLIDINSVDDERIVQEVLNSKMEQMTPNVDISDLTKVDIKTPEQEAEVQAQIDERRAAAKERMLSNTIPSDDTGTLAEEASQVDDKTIDEQPKVEPGSNQGDSKFIDYVVTEDDIINNPQFAERGIVIGETVEIPNPNYEAPEKPEAKSEIELNKMKKDELIAYAQEIGLEFDDDKVTNNPERIKAILDFQNKE
jgi:hypothetical protein